MAMKKNHQITILPDYDSLYSIRVVDDGKRRINSAPIAEELTRVSPIFVISPEEEKLKRDIYLSIYVGKKIEKNMALFRSNGERWEFVGRGVDGERIVGKSRYFGRYAIFKDNCAPIVKFPEDNGKSYEREYRFHVEDGGSGVDVARCNFFIDGIKLKYRFEGEEVVLSLPPRLVEGVHRLTGELYDRTGNLMRLGERPLRAAGFMDVVNVMPYPNPATSFCRIRYTLGKSVSDLKIKFYDGSGRKVYTMNEFGPSDMSAGVHDSPVWFLENGKMRKVSNGTYFYRIIIRDDSGKRVVKKGKIAVVR
jgi:hypothetical protein